MPRKKTPAQLRAEARKLIKKAEEEERSRHIEIGRIVADFAGKNFEGFDLDDFKATAVRILSE